MTVPAIIYLKGPKKINCGERKIREPYVKKSHLCKQKGTKMCRIQIQMGKICEGPKKLGKSRFKFVKMDPF
jgi:hypothetical protein